MVKKFQEFKEESRENALLVLKLSERELQQPKIHSMNIQILLTDALAQNFGNLPDPAFSLLGLSLSKANEEHPRPLQLKSLMNNFTGPQIASKTSESHVHSGPIPIQTAINIGQNGSNVLKRKQSTSPESHGSESPIHSNSSQKQDVLKNILRMNNGIVGPKPGAKQTMGVSHLLELNMLHNKKKSQTINHEANPKCIPVFFFLIL